MATVRFIYGFVCIAFLGSNIEYGSCFLSNILFASVDDKDRWKPNDNNAKALSVLEIATSQIGVREATGKNDGEQVEKYLKYTGNRKGEPWCASFVSWVFGQAGFKQPRTAWSPALFPYSRMVNSAAKARVFGIYFANKGRIAHAGLVESRKGNWLYTIEGNTNMAGSREGDGVYRKIRHVKTIKAYANWLPKQRGNGL